MKIVFYQFLLFASLLGCLSSCGQKSNKRIVLSNQQMSSLSLFKAEISEKMILGKDGEYHEESVEIETVKNEISPENFKGTIYFFWGNLEDDVTEFEWSQLFLVTRYLSKKNYKIVLNTFGKREALLSALKDPGAMMISWSSHGDGGVLRDKNLNLIPHDFFKLANKNLKQLIISSCDGEEILKNYVFPATLEVKTWIGTTNSEEMFNYYKSDEWISKYQ